MWPAISRPIRTCYQNLFWRDPNDAPLVKDLNSDVSISFGAGNSASHDGGFSSAGDGTPFDPLHTQLALQARGIYTANVSVKIANLPAGLKFYEPFDKINLSIARSTSVAIDPWTAGSPAQVDSKIAGNPAIFPASSLAAVSSQAGAAITAIDPLGGIAAPKLGQLDFWTDVVPQDRLRSRQ
jgi:hypothetical protein